MSSGLCKRLPRHAPAALLWMRFVGLRTIFLRMPALAVLRRRQASAMVETSLSAYPAGSDMPMVVICASLPALLIRLESSLKSQHLNAPDHQW